MAVEDQQRQRLAALEQMRERAAIMEYHGLLPRHVAERLAQDQHVAGALPDAWRCECQGHCGNELHSARGCRAKHGDRAHHSAWHERGPVGPLHMVAVAPEHPEQRRVLLYLCQTCRAGSSTLPALDDTTGG